MNKLGRRVKDKVLAQQRMDAIMEKKEKSRREDLTLAEVKRVAKTQKPTNDLMLQSSDETIELRIRLKEMSVIKFWDKMRDKSEYKTMFAIAKQCFPLLERFKFEHGVAKTTKNGKVTRSIRDLPKDIRKHVKR